MDYTAHHHQQGYDTSAQAVHHHQGYDPSDQPVHLYQGYDPSAQPVHPYQGYAPSAQAVHHYQGYDPAAQPQQFYNQPTEDYYSYAYSNPQYANSNPYPYHSVNAQPSQHGEQEPNPPGVAVLPPPQHDPNAYYHSLDYGAAPAYTMGPQQGGVDAGVAMVHQPIVQSSYNNIATLNGVAHPGIAQNHPGPIQNFSARPYRGRGHGHGRGRGRSLHKRQDQTVFTQDEAAQPMPQLYGPNLGPTPVPLMAQVQLAPPPKHLWCELCKVECNSIEILNRHNSGKKHLKKLKTFEESQKTSTFKPDQILASANQQLPQESSLPSQLPQDINDVAEAKPLWCELCKASCNTLETFNEHLNGKKHQKKLKTFEKLEKNQIGVQTELVSGPELKPKVPSQPEQESLPSREINEEIKVAVEKQQAEGLGSTEQAGKNAKTRGSKRKMRGGKVDRSVRSKWPVEPPQPKLVIPLLCELCNVKCESQVVFQSHIVGKKHLLNAKRFLSENETLGQEVFQILRHAIQTLNEQNVNASSTSYLDSHLDHQGLLSGHPVGFQDSTLENNLESAGVGDTSQQLLPTDIGGCLTMTNGEGILNEGHSESDLATAHLVSS